VARRRKKRLSAEGSYQLHGDALEIQLGVFDIAGANPANDYVYEPSERHLVAKAGAWAMVTRALPPMEHRLDEQVRVGRVFWVTHWSDGCDDQGFQPDGSYKVRCLSPWGDLGLWPYEYSVMAPARLTALWTEGALVFHPLDLGQAQFDAVVFYCRSRGIGLADAAVMALGTLSGRVGWFEPAPDIAPDLEAMATRVNQWPWDNTKRLAARARRKEEQ